MSYFIAIVAVNVQPDGQLAIGCDNKLIIKSRVDMQHFKQKTRGSVCIMGSKTFDSLNSPNGLVTRHCIVLTRDTNRVSESEHVTYVNSIEAAVDLANQMSNTIDWPTDVYVIGGEQIYRDFEPHLSMIICSMFNEQLDVEPDAFFPISLEDNWVAYVSESIGSDTDGFVKVNTYIKKSVWDAAYKNNLARDIAFVPK